MKWLYTFLLVLILSVSCEDAKIPEMVRQESTTISIEHVSKPYCNPAIVYGSDMGHFIQQLFRQSRFGDLLKFTSTESRKKFGDKKLIGFYENKFHIDFELGKLTSMQTVKDTINLIYSNTQLLGTRRKIVIPVIVENDTSKIIITSLVAPFKSFNE